MLFLEMLISLLASALIVIVTSLFAPVKNPQVSIILIAGLLFALGRIYFWMSRR